MDDFREYLSRAVGFRCFEVVRFVDEQRWTVRSFLQIFGVTVEAKMLRLL